MRKDSNLEHNNIFVIAACLGAQAIFSTEGFRQKDLKFLIEMFSNWVDITLKDRVLFVHNTQIMRYLHHLTAEGFAQKITRKGQPRFRLTRVGLITLLTQLIERPPQFPLEHFFFGFHMVETYRNQIEMLVKSEGQQFPSALKIELDALFDLQKMIDQQIAYVRIEHKKLKQRIADSEEVEKLVKKMRIDKKSIKEISSAIEKQYPYDLNSQKSLAQFYNEIPKPIADWILDSAITKRREQIWNPIAKILETHLEILERLREASHPKKGSKVL
ncbi:MAG: exported protein of unknown function [Bacteriovoracaceae bacterium]|nr:exported protein of unknown function [Bacteriovoracaceae bacterium]